jgi:transposase
MEGIVPIEQSAYSVFQSDPSSIPGVNPTIEGLSQAIEKEAEKCPEAGRLMSNPGVGALTALAFVLILGGW